MKVDVGWTLHGVSLSGAGLSVSYYCAVEAVETVADEGGDDVIVYRLLGLERTENTIEGKLGKVGRVLRRRRTQ